MVTDYYVVTLKLELIAFFCQKRFSKLFKDVPNDINQIYSEPRYLLHKNFGHKKSIELITQIINS